MKAPAEQSPEPQRQAAAHEAPQQQDNSDAEFQFIDNRAETASLRQLQEAADNSPRTQGLAQLNAMMNNNPRSDAIRSLQAMVDNSPRRATQLRQHNRVQGAPMGLQASTDDVLVQRVEDEEVLQGEFVAESPAQLAQPSEAKSNNTGLPDKLKAGVESLSGLSLDNVKVHYNSSEPAQLNAHAYAQGTDIHVRPGQEQHLPHEAWHVVQQAQGRVKPALQMKDGVGVNDDQGLEAEADLMGEKAVAGVVQARQESGSSNESDPIGGIVQRTTILIGYKDNDDMFKAALTEQASPNPIVAFTDSGVPDTSDEVTAEIARHAKKGKDRSQLILVGHGSPGKMGKLNLPNLMNTLKDDDLFNEKVTDVNLIACYSMMKEDLGDSSMAYKLALWLKDHITIAEEFQQAVKLVAGYTSNTSGEAVKGGQSYEVLDKNATFGAHNFNLYIYYKVLKRLIENDGFSKEDRKGSTEVSENWNELKPKVWGEIEMETIGLQEDLIKVSPKQPWGATGQRTEGKKFTINQAGIENENKLSTGYVIASVDTKNYQDFPGRFAMFQNVKSAEGEINAILNGCIDVVYESVKPKAQGSGDGFKFGGGFTFGGSGGGFKFDEGSLSKTSTGGGFSFGLPKSTGKKDTDQ